MKLLWTIAFSIIFLTHVRSQDISGTWLSDWQNQGLLGCYPDNFTITNSSAPIIVYSFSSEIFYTYCYPPHNPPTTSNIYSSSTNEYYDSNSYFQFTYDPDTDSLSVIFYETSGAYLFNRNGASIPQETALGTLGKTWTNKVPAQASESATTCCVPDSIFIALSNPYHYLQAQFNAVFYYNITSCSQTTNYNFQLSTTSPTTLSWNSTNNNSIFYTPSDDATEWTFLLSSNNGTCNYTYTPATTPSDVPSYSWLQDWQTTPDQFSPWNYEVTYKGQDPYSYMVSNITFQNGSSYQSFLVQTPQGQYFDPYLNINGTTFSYNSTKNTLLSISTNRATEDALLLSPTGNLFSASDFYSYWTNPVSTNTQALPSDCCVPIYIDIANNGSGSHYASVIYYFASNYTSNLGCQDIQHSIDNYQLESTLSIQTPNISQLVWTDVFGNQIYFANPSDISVIQVSNFVGQCSFNMEITSTPPSTPTPTPTPLYSSMVSLGSISLLIGLLVI